MISFIVGETSMKKLKFQTPTNLADDLTNEVINHLPVKSNFRFKCVSKQWFSLNTEALKRKSQTLTMSGIFYGSTRGANDGLSVTYAKTQKGQDEDYCIDGTLSFLPKHLNMRICGSCNGLLLCEGWDKPDYFTCLFNQTSYLYVCNPATRNWVKIPYGYTNTFLVIILDFNPLISIHFNVIKITSCDYRLHKYSFEVFSSKTEEWKVSEVTNPKLAEYVIRDYAISVFKGLIFCLNWESTDIMGFDLEGNCIRRIELPGKSHRKHHCSFSSCCSSRVSLFQMGGSLHYHYLSGNEMFVWKLADFERGSWSLKNNFRLMGPLSNTVDLEFHPQIEDVLLLRIMNKIHSYNMQTAEMTELCSLPSPSLYFPYSPCYLQGFGKQSRK